MIIGINGKFGAGKDTVAAMLCNHYGYKRLAFADKLKSIAMSYNNSSIDDMLITIDLFGKVDENIQKQIRDIMNRVQPHGWRKLTFSECHHEKTDFSRKILQTLAEEIRQLDQNVWAMYILNAVRNHRNSHFVISDLRYINEASLIQVFSGFIWKVERPDVVDENDPLTKHISENDLNDFDQWDCIINNDGTLEDLKVKVDQEIKRYQSIFHKEN